MVKSKVFIDSIWSFIERFSVQGLQFLFSIILARLLSPSDYGLIAMLSIFFGSFTNIIGLWVLECINS
ncbi:oligosaccharide flippase family protein [Bacteroides fragilis]